MQRMAMFCQRAGDACDDIAADHVDGIATIDVGGYANPPLHNDYDDFGANNAINANISPTSHCRGVSRGRLRCRTVNGMG
jgi:hypothetical protein